MSAKKNGILYLNFDTEKAEVMERDWDNEDYRLARDGYHSMKWMIATQTYYLTDLQKEANLINATLQWDLRFQGESFFIVATYVRNNERDDVQLTYVEGNFRRWNVFETFASLSEALEARATLLAE